MEVNCRNCGARPHAIECDYCGTPAVIGKPKPKRTEIDTFAQWYNSSSTAPYNDYHAKLQNAGHGVFQLQNVPQPSGFWGQLISGGLASAGAMFGR